MLFSKFSIFEICFSLEEHYVQSCKEPCEIYLVFFLEISDIAINTILKFMKQVVSVQVNILNPFSSHAKCLIVSISFFFKYIVLHLLLVTQFLAKDPFWRGCGI